MQKTIFTLLVLFSLSPTLLLCQYGIRFNYGNLKYTKWDESITAVLGKSEDAVFNPQYELGIDYWFRLEKKRLEFSPELAFSFAKTENALGKFKQNMFLLYWNVNIYPLDFGGDCNCPTFSKEGNSIKKGFFIHAAPIFGYQSQSTDAIIGIGNVRYNSTFFGIRSGIGLDLGINDLITVTPMVSYEYLPSISWSGIDLTQSERKTSASGIQAGFRLGFRWDYGRNGRRR